MDKFSQEEILKLYEMLAIQIDFDDAKPNQFQDWISDAWSIEIRNNTLEEGAKNG